MAHSASPASAVGHVEPLEVPSDSETDHKLTGGRDVMAEARSRSVSNVSTGELLSESDVGQLMRLSRQLRMFARTQALKHAHLQSQVRMVIAYAYNRVIVRYSRQLADTRATSFVHTNSYTFASCSLMRKV
jgi:hypothetical protein